MKIPVRPAPAPPSYRPSTAYQRSHICFDSWDDVNDPFSDRNISRSFTNIKSMPTVKKKPPPRPPPPKINNHVHQNIKQNKSNVLSNLFSKSSRHSSSSASTIHKQIISKDHNIVVASLIDFDSPSSSPTFTTRSSSDGVSVNSFGSDGSTSNNGNTPSAGTSSLFESGFEDDFDFFGGLSSDNVKTPNTFDNQDPWSIDPFSPPPPQKSEVPSNAGNSSWFNNSSGNEDSIKSVSNTSVKHPPTASAMPTIIRPKPGRPSTLPKPLQMLQPHMKENKQMRESVFTTNQHRDVTNNIHEGGGDESREGSPPMPSIPPPPPPINVDASDIPLVLPDLPPRNAFMNKAKTPHGIAIYDYSTSHPDDLAFKSNDLIHLVKKINNEWFLGEIGDRRGMFPANFIEIIVPLDENETNLSSPKTVTALYPFPAQQWDDLAFPEGAVIKVLGQINADWLYGEYQGKTGQFPSSFVDHIPGGLPQRKILG